MVRHLRVQIGIMSMKVRTVTAVVQTAPGISHVQAKS
jgi:hypothetical protein